MNIKGLALGLALTALAGPASALVYTLNVSGNIISGYGDGNQEIYGPQFTAQFRVDTAKDPYEGITWSFQSPSLTTSYEAPYYISVEASPTDHYQLRTDDSWAYAQAYGPDFSIARGHEVDEALWADDYYSGGLDIGWQDFLSLDFSFMGIPGLVGPGGIPKNRPLGPDAEITGWVADLREYRSGYLDARPPTGFALRGTSYSVGVSVPEPTTWVLMIGGFGLTGATLRRNRRQALAG